MADCADVRLHGFLAHLPFRPEYWRETRRRPTIGLRLSASLVLAGSFDRGHPVVAGLAELPPLSAFLQFIQRDLRFAGGADHFDVVVLSDWRRNSAGRCNHLRVGNPLANLPA